MIAGKKVLAMIPARGGSKGIKDKNICNLAGKPLIWYTIEAAQASKYIDGIMINTDSEKIKVVCEELGVKVPALRPEKYASDRAKTIDAVVWALDWLDINDMKYDILVLLQPTSPLRSTLDIDSAIEKFVDFGCASLLSVSKSEVSPVHLRMIDDEGKMTKLLNLNSTVRRQDMPEYYRVNGSIYINLISEVTADTSFNDNVVPYVVDEMNAVDVDRIEDIYLAEYYINSEGFKQMLK